VESGLGDILCRQVGAAIDLLENVVNARPDELWRRPWQLMGVWFMKAS
jgi:hypothetical protein